MLQLCDEIDLGSFGDGSSLDWYKTLNANHQFHQIQFGRNRRV